MAEKTVSFDQTEATRMGFGPLCFLTTSLTTSTNSGTSSLVDCGLYASAMCMSMCGSAGVTGRSTIEDVEWLSCTPAGTRHTPSPAATRAHAVYELVHLVGDVHAEARLVRAGGSDG